MSDKAALFEEKIDSEEVFSGNLLKVRRDHARLPNGNTATREWIKHPGAAAVLPVFSNGDVLLIKQFRYPLGKVFYEMPAGKIDPGESPEQAAAREIREEAGVSYKTSQELAHFYPAIGYSDEVIHLYVAWELEEIGQQSDDDEFLIPERMPFSRALRMTWNGEISDGKTALGILRAWHWWQQEGPFPINWD